MLKRILIYGAAAGLVVGTMLSVMALLGRDVPNAAGMAIGYATMLIAFSAIFVAIKRQRDREGDGAIRFWSAFAMGLGISIVAGIIYALAWEVALALSGGDFIGDYTAKMIAEKQAAGASAAELARYAAEMNALKVSYADPLYRLPLTFAEIFPVGVLVSLVSAGLLRNPRFLPARRVVAV